MDNIYQIISGKLNNIFIKTCANSNVDKNYCKIINLFKEKAYTITLKVINKVDNSGIPHTLEIKSLFDDRYHKFEVDDKIALSEIYGTKKAFNEGKYKISIKPKYQIQEDESYLTKEITLSKNEIVEFLLTVECFEKSTLVYPVDGYSQYSDGGFDFGANWTVGSQFTTLNKTKKYALHTGVDLKGAKGTTVYAIYDGVVKANYSAGEGWGNAITIEHICPCNGKYTSNYTHTCSNLKSGDSVKKGEPIGKLCDISVPHLHFGIRKGEYSNISNRGALPSEEVDASDTKWHKDDKPVFDKGNFLNPTNFKYEFKGPTT